MQAVQWSKGVARKCSAWKSQLVLLASCPKIAFPLHFPTPPPDLNSHHNPPPPHTHTSQFSQLRNTVTGIRVREMWRGDWEIEGGENQEDRTGEHVFIDGFNSSFI